MQFIHKKNFKKVPFIKEAHSASFIVPIDSSAQPIDSKLLSHKNAPSTLKAQIVDRPQGGTQVFADLKDISIIDFPGMFEIGNSILEIAT